MTYRDTHKPGHQTCFADRRKNRRLKVRLDVAVRLHRGAGVPPSVEKASTRDISPGDLYFESSLADRLQIADVVDLEIELPIRSSTIFSERLLAAKGRVVRFGPPSSEVPNRRGVALIFVTPPAFGPAVE